MGQITSGRVVFSRTTQPADYQSKRAEVELVFTLEDDDDPDETLTNVMEKAKDEVLRTLGIRKA